MSDEKKPNNPNRPPSPQQGGSASEAAGRGPEQAGGDAPAPGEGDAEIGIAQLKAIVAALQSDLEAKTQELAQKHDQFVRAAAETENVRRRLEKEKEETARYAITKFAKDILGIGDNFQRAISAVPREALDTDPALKSLLDGVVLAERDYRTVLERHGIAMIDPAGQPFDPHRHQAVMEQENTEVPNSTVLQTFQVGYLLDDRCLRPAMVVVSRGGPKAARNGDGAPPAADGGPAASD